MNIQRVQGVPLLISLTVIVVLGVLIWPESFDEPSYPSTRTIRYGFTIQNPTSHPLKEAGFWVYIPYHQTSTQKRLNIKTSHPYEVKHDDQGNERLTFTMMLPPHGSKEVWIESTLAMSDVPNRFSPKAVALSAGSPTFVEASAPEIIEQAEKLHQEDAEQASWAIYDWVRQHITYSGYLKDDRGAVYALKNAQGDCTEYAYLTATLGQVQSIPVRVMAGFVMPQNGILVPTEYHNWAEFNLDNAWRLVDAQKEVYLENPSRYISMRIVGDVVRNKNDNSQRLFDGFGGVQIEMKTPRPAV